MLSRNVKMIAGALSLLLCLPLCGCRQEKPVNQLTPIATTQSSGSILVTTAPTETAVDYTPVYASCFGDTVILSTVPQQMWNELEPDCDPREISLGGCVACRGEHEKEVPITKVIILEDIVPRSTVDWFRDLTDLESVEGEEKLHMEYVTDMNHMFYGCENLAELDTSTWDVTDVEDMTGLFQGCAALTELPDWYQ